MRRFGLAVAIAFAAMIAGVPAASAKAVPEGGLTRAEVLEWLKKKGLNAKLDHDDVAKDDTVTVTGGDITWSIYFYGCANERCKSLQYAASWKGEGIPVDQVNQWNSGRRFLRAYRTNSGYIFAEYDVDIIPGGNWELVDASLDRWKKQVPIFATFLKTGKLP